MNIIIFGLVLMLLCVGCGSAAADSVPNASDLTTNRRRVTFTVPSKPVEEQEKDENAKKEVYFGSEDAAGCKDFKYLTEKLLTTSKTKSKQETEISVYVPDGDNPHASGASAKSVRAGVSVKVDLEPYIQYKPEEYSLSENLETYVAGEIDYYYESYFELEVGEIEELNKKKSSVCQMNFMKYNSFEDTYAPFYVVYSLHKIDDGVLALVEISIDADNTTNETKALLEELSSFYRIPIQWEASFAELKRAKFENTGQAVDGVFYFDCLSFELPTGWEMDESMSGGNMVFYAPDGDAIWSDVYLAITEVVEADGFVSDILEEAAAAGQMFEEEGLISSYVVEDMGFTFLGNTVWLEMNEYDVSVEASYLIILIFAEDDKNQYGLIAYCMQGEGEELSDEETQLREAIEMFFETGRVNNAF